MLCFSDLIHIVFGHTRNVMMLMMNDLILSNAYTNTNTI